MKTVIIGRILNKKSALKWAVHVDLSLHLSQRDANRGIGQILVLLPLVVLVCCRIVISSNDINLLVLNIVDYFC